MDFSLEENAISILFHRSFSETAIIMRIYSAVYILALNASVTVLSEGIFKYNQVMLDHFLRP